MSNRIFYIPGLNGIRWSNENPLLDTNLNTLPVENEIDLQSYAAPIQQSDTQFPALILLSDYPDMLLQFFISATEELISTETLTATDSSIIGQTFSQYLAVVNFSSFPIGWCYARVSYTDDNDVYQSWISCPIDVQETHPGTQLFQYQNSYNTESVLFFPSDIILQMRVESNMIGGYQPKSSLQTMQDQPEYSPVLLQGYAYDVYTNYVGGPQIPDWVVRKLNLIWSKCDQVKIDYEFYVPSGDWKVDRPNYTHNRNGMWERDLQIVPGYSFGSLTAGTTPTGDLIVIRQSWPLAPFPNFTGPFVINGVFTIYSTLDYLQVINLGLQTFTLLLGTTSGGAELRTLKIGTPNPDSSIDLISVHDIGQGFNEATTVYCTVPNGVNIKVFFVYDQLDSPPLNLPPSGASGNKQGTICYYKELVAGYFARDWDITTGFGQVGSLYEGAQIYDEAAGKVFVAWDRTTIDPDFGRGTPGVTGALQVGNPGNEVSITQSGLPNIGLGMFTNEINGTDGDYPGLNDTVAKENGQSSINRKDYSMRKGTIPSTVGVTNPMGAGGSINIGNDGLILLAYIWL